jgi:hypothetical protein
MLGNIFSDRIYVMLAESRGGSRPEFRLPLMIGGAALMPVVVALYGWVPYAQVASCFLDVLP